MAKDWTQDEAIKELERIIAKQDDEIERLREQLRYQEHRDNRIGTHDPVCYAYGPSHYECALSEIERLRKALRLMPKTITDAADEIERLREEVDELKDLIQATVDYTGASVSSNRFTFHASKRFVSLKEKE